MFVLPYVQRESMMAVEDESALPVDLGAGTEQARLQDGISILSFADVGVMGEFASSEFRFAGLRCVVGSCYVCVDHVADLTR